MPNPEDPTDPKLDPASHAGTTESARDGARKRRDPNEPAAVVGIGASAGGIAPLQQFFEEMKPDSGLAFVVVMHLSPDFESQLAAVLQQKTTMPVVQVSEPVKVRPNHVYVIPPNHQLTFAEGMLRLLPPQRELGRRVTIDLFFRTLAHAYGQRAVSIILSGTDSDGVIGLKHVRAQGGVTIAQEPEEAEFDSMPQSAIATGMVDWVLQVADMPRRLLKFVRNENAMQLPPEIRDAPEPDAKVKDAPGGETISNETRDPDDEGALFLVLKHLRAHTSHDFSHYKRATILRRVARRLQVNSIDSMPRYLEFLRGHPAEVSALLSDLLIGVTHFFRDHAAFAALDANVAQLFAGKEREDEVRVWVCGCATGEEAYSMAMLLCEHADRLSNPPSLQVFATDIDEQSIQEAREGVYPLTIEADISQERLRQFFVRDNGRYRVKKDLRDKVLFATHNVLTDPAFSRLDLVSCRNLLIYLNREAQTRVFDVFHFALHAGGLLFIGGAETADHAQALFSPIDSQHRIYARRSLPRPAWRIPAIPARVARPRHALPGETYPPMLPRMASAAVEGAGDQTQTAAFEGQQRRSVLFGELHLKLLEEYGPPSVVVNEAHDIVHLSEHAGRYLTFRAGEPSTNLMTVVHPDLRVELRTALFRAAQSNENVIVPAQHVEMDGGTETIDLHVRPIRPGDSAHGFFLVLFERRTTPLTAEEKAEERETISREVGDELHSLNEQLNATVEQFEASSEELKASNEELQAMNEELRSAAEELETSKEQLQSVNEELITVNQELKEKVEELSRANSDLNNLLAATDLATIFLDRSLRVVRFTPRITETFNLRPADVGRPISDITHKLRYETLIADAERVLDRLVPVERDIETDDGRSILTRIAPYRTLDDKISGVVVTLIDVTLVTQVQKELREREQFVRSTIDSFTSMIAIINREAIIIDVNKSWKEFARENGYGGTDHGVGDNYLEVTRRAADEGTLDAARIWNGIVAVLEGKSDSFEFEYPCHSPHAFRWFMVNVSPLETSAGGAVIWHTDITARRKAEEASRASEERVRTIADNVPQLIWTNDGEGVANYFNKRWFDYSGLSHEESYGRGWEAIVHPADAPSSVDRWRQALAKGEVFDAEYRLRAADGKYRWFIGRNVPLRTNGTVVSWFGTATDIDDLKNAQSRAGETEERFRLLVEGAKDYAMFLLDLDNIITFWSAGAERVFGWSEAEAIGQSGAMIFTPEDRARGEVEKEINTALAEGRALDRRFHLRKDGSKLWTDGVLMRIDEQDGRLRGFAKVARDATDRRRTEDELAHARDELEQRVLERTREVVAMNTELEQTMAQRQQLERELLEISEREKRRIGEDLHDMVCQELTATALFLKSSAKKVGPKSPAAQVLEESAETVNRNVVIARELAGGLQAIELSASGLKNALRDLAAQACQNSGLRCHFKAARGVRVPDDAVALHLYRVAQEAVNNAVKHSGAKNILISLDRNAENICVSVQDDGKGFVPRRRGKGLGLHMMRYRANALGGELKVNRRRTGGTEITCVIPIKR